MSMNGSTAIAGRREGLAVDWATLASLPASFATKQ
jgi:hypothetical protein